jgi:hypothetical protein
MACLRLRILARQNRRRVEVDSSRKVDRNAVISNGLTSPKPGVNLTRASGAQLPTLPNILPANSPFFAASPGDALISPRCRAPYVLETSMQIELGLPAKAH